MSLSFSTLATTGIQLPLAPRFLPTTGIYLPLELGVPFGPYYSSAELWTTAARALGDPTMLRDLIYIGAAEWSNTIDAIIVATTDDPPVLTPITAVQRGRLGALRRVARMRCGLTPGELPLGPMPALGATPVVFVAPGPSAPSAPYGSRLKLSSLVQQGLDVDLVQITPNEIRVLRS
jgi:hypothetical protein